ncbi:MULTISPECIES: IPTL-CTERM sorting domain-containing protein [unclassified Acidovorax]|uniref:IPTL-CTERM sorting domain-containing protein n=1 Tax=unclassified Acidovorax TaxID=2684926 RepID=UPI001124E18B|nr:MULTISPECIES: IPTL-CTERM sorting domain-containing protein [unclassified Acidovorax]MBD9391409.1 IPTL-CTERM sorting domain-containing protein [Acidovorax sp. ACV01]
MLTNRGNQKMFKKSVWKWLGSLACLLGAVGAAQAQSTTYVATAAGNYTGFTNFTVCGTPPCQNFTAAMSTSGSFTTTAPLAANLASAQLGALVSAFSFSDGLTTYTHTDPNTRVWNFRVTTDASGAITGVNILIQRWISGAAPHNIGDRFSFFETSTTAARHNMFCSGIAVSTAGVADSCGFAGSDTSTSSAIPVSLVWSAAVAASSIPTLSEWALMAMAGWMAMVAFQRLQRRDGKRLAHGQR